ncbi:SAM-dependent DNA methyltransferase [Aureimonas sp. SK2]|uniref:SAM-dependent DNA methyltransferase n=1 Tax=Aureimonas sp. SK2 TaxID=3015992 RepID=UPI002444244D|nr:SAM-dependent DNA methyltransferase [Aureimonas sp. SK2]
MRARGFTAVMNVRRSPPKVLDYFPTPPWGTRAGAELIRSLDGCANGAAPGITISEPACGGGHMAHVLADEFGLDNVAPSDVFDYGWQHEVADFLSPDWGAYRPAPDWIITNPPFKVAEQFALLALKRARRGVALLLRANFAEGGGRYERLFRPHPPTVEAIFCDRLPMVEGRWDPEASTATAYSWFIWTLPGEGVRWGDGYTERRWIAPGTRDGLWKPDDVRRFVPMAPAPLLERLA